MKLSPRETEILRYVAAGRTTKETATAIGVAETTVEWHMANVLIKLGAASRSEAVAIAMREGLLAAGDQTADGVEHELRGGRRVDAEEEERVIAVDLLGLHLGNIRIRGRRRAAAQADVKTRAERARKPENHD